MTYPIPAAMPTTSVPPGPRYTGPAIRPYTGTVHETADGLYSYTLHDLMNGRTLFTSETGQVQLTFESRSAAYRWIHLQETRAAAR